MPNEITYVTDTHSLIWYLTASPRLGQAAYQAFTQVARGEAKLIVPVIVIAELIFVVESSRAQVDVDGVIQRLSANPVIEITSLTLDLALAMRTATVIAEMHDRLIVCEAQMRHAKLITHDREIQHAQIVETVW
jgi:PIN domain nuclease of toxin-antitoxin system